MWASPDQGEGGSQVSPEQSWRGKRKERACHMLGAKRFWECGGKLASSAPACWGLGGGGGAPTGHPRS